MDQYVLNVEISGRKENIVSFVQALRQIQYCDMGLCQSLELVIEGAGTADMKFRIKDGDKFHKLESRESADRDKIWIGE
jgi:hypothetical protein